MVSDLFRGFRLPEKGERHAITSVPVRRILVEDLGELRGCPVEIPDTKRLVSEFERRATPCDRQGARNQ